MSRRPPILEEVALTPEDEGILTFSNGTEWEGWADHNCLSCRWYDPDCAGGKCAFEGAALLGRVSPALAEQFGWVRDEAGAAQWCKEHNEPDDIRQWWMEPQRCPFFKDEDDDSPDPPVIDPTQLTFLAPEGWPTVLDVPVPVGAV